MHNLVTSYDFQLGQNHWTWIWIFSLHTAEECWISRVLLGFYREFLRGHMAESPGALVLACMALVYIDKCIFGMKHSFQYIIVNVLSKSVVSLSYTRSNTSVTVFSIYSSVLY